MIEGLKTFGWVSVLTLLIWIYAVREQVFQPSSPNVRGVVVNFTSSNHNLYVEYAGSGQPTVDLQLTGPQQSLAQVTENLTTLTVGKPQGLTIDLGSDFGVGNKQPVNIVDRIQNDVTFKNSGVTVQLSAPADLLVNVDNLKHHDVPVRAQPGVTNLAPESRFDPAMVTVSGPQTLVDKIDAVYAKLDGYEQIKQPGSYTISSVLLGFSPQQPQPEKLSISPNQVTANLAVTAFDVTDVIPYSIPVYVQTPATLNVDVQLNASDRTMANIHVTGPRQAIDSIKQGAFKVTAVLNVTQDDTGDLDRAPVYELPPGVTVASEDAGKTVHFTVNRR